MSALYLFYFEDSRGFTLTQANILLAIYILAGLAGAFLRLAGWTGKSHPETSKNKPNDYSPVPYTSLIRHVRDPSCVGFDKEIVEDGPDSRL